MVAAGSGQGGPCLVMSSTQPQIVWLDFRNSPCWTFSATLPAVTLLVLSDFKEHHQKARDHTGQGDPRSTYCPLGCGGT